MHKICQCFSINQFTIIKKILKTHVRNTEIYIERMKIKIIIF